MIDAARTYASPCPCPPHAGKGEGVASFNGNITELQRNAGGTLIDNLEYYYDHENHTDKLGLVSNRLYLVDEQSTHTGGNDLKKGSLAGVDFDRNSPGSWNYHYDPIGNLTKDVNEGIDLITWTVTGKGREGSFEYRTRINERRMMKYLIMKELQQASIGFYFGIRQSSFFLTSKIVNRCSLFGVQIGSSRIGMVTQPEQLTQPNNDTLRHTMVLGLKVYEFSNHLGNVLTTFSDRKIAIEGAPGYVAYYTAEILSSTDYYPFGFEMPGRVYQGSYRFGFNGMEKDDEVKGSGNSLTTFFRQYDTRIGVWFSVDPKATWFPWISPYSTFNNNPIFFCDPIGDYPPPTVNEAHRLYFKTAGIEIFKKNLENGFSLLGAAFALGQSATESSYGNLTDLNRKIKKNNFWGMMSGGRTITYSSLGSGYDAWSSMMNNRFPNAMKLLKKPSFSIDEMQKALNPGKDEPYNYDPGNDDYSNYMMNVAKNALKRMVIVLDEEIKSKQKEAEGLVARYEGGKPVFKTENDRIKYNSLQKDIKGYEDTRAKAELAIKEVDKALSSKKEQDNKQKKGR